MFSLAYGSVHEELLSKGELKRAPNIGNKKESRNNRRDMGKDAVKVSEEGVTFRS